MRICASEAAMLIRPLLAGLVLVVLGAAEAAAQEAIVPPSPLPLGWCLERAALANPEVASDAAAADAARERVAPAGALPDPRFGYQATNVPTSSWDFNSTPMSGHQLTLAQKLPFPGLLGSRQDAARAGAEAAEGIVRDRERQVAATVERAWAQLGFAQRALEITDRNLELLRQLTRIAETKYRVGTGLQQDVLRAQVELTRLLDERIGRVASISQSEAALAAVLDLGPGTAFGRTEELAEGAPLPEVEPILGRLEGASPVLRALRARIQEAEDLRRVAELDGYPDFDLGFGYRIRERVAGDPVSGEDFLTAGVTVRLPVNRSKWRSHVAERRALLRRAEADYRAGRAQLRSALRSRYAELRRADAAVALLETGLVPQSRQSLEASRAGYEVDKVDFLSLVDSQVSLLEAELRLERARAERRVAFAGLEAASGESLR
ncbi:MAG: TolC family protein [Deltaproteobacteria bacterium]|nr:TolC family protein [Deltaproteobacteria bacterium]